MLELLTNQFEATRSLIDMVRDDDSDEKEIENDLELLFLGPNERRFYFNPKIGRCGCNKMDV